MTIYEILERLIIGPVFRSDEEQAAIEVIHQLRDMNALGTVATQTDLTTHECELVPPFPQGGHWRPYCRICGKET